MNKRNHEHYKDPKPYDAIKKMQDEADAADAKRMDDALRIAKMAFSAAGFELVERIVLKNIRTGKVYR